MAPQGDKSAYTDKQRRQAGHIEESVKRRGGGSRAAARIAYATVNKQDGGGKKSGSGRKGASSSRSASSRRRPSARSSNPGASSRSGRGSRSSPSRSRN